MTEYIVRPIGVVRSVLIDPADAPKQGALTGQEAEIVVDPSFLPALDGLEERVARVRGMDAIDGTPVVDIKSPSPELDG